METIPPNSTGKLAEAFAKAQGSFKTPTLNRSAKIKNAQGVSLYETHYADLEECISCIKKPLSENGLSWSQSIDFIHSPKELWVLKLELRHSSGEAINSILPLNINQSPQQLGGSLTYFKRYQLSAFFGLAADFDDDGNAAEDKGNVVDGKAKDKKPTSPQSPQAFPQTGSIKGNPTTSVSKAASQVSKPQAKPSDPEYFDDVPEYNPGDFNDLDAALSDKPIMSLQEQLFKLVDDRAIPIDEVKRIIKQFCGGVQKKTDQMTDKEIDSVIQYIKLTKK
jgi:hypothetical protein